MSYEESEPQEVSETTIVGKRRHYVPGGDGIYIEEPIFETRWVSYYDIYKVTKITSWIENSCSPDVKKNVVSTSNKEFFKRVSESGRLTEDGKMPSSEVKSHPVSPHTFAPQIYIPPRVPDYILAFMLSGGITGATRIGNYYGVKPDPTRYQPGSNPDPTPQDTMDLSSTEQTSSQELGNSNPGASDMRLSFYGYDRSDDESIHLNNGPGFNYRDQQVREMSIGSTITREDLLSAKIVNNGHIPNNWDTAIVVGADFRPFSDVPKDCEAYSVSYGYWVLHLRSIMGLE